MVRRLLAPRWLALHALAVVAFLVLVRLGLWQWHRAEALGRVQNYAYAVEWWLFAAFAVFLWVKTMVDTAEERPDQADGADETDAPAPAPVVPVVDDEDDPELAAYNRHLAALHARSLEQR